MHCFLEVGVQGLRRYGDEIFFSPMHVMKKTITHSNGVEKGVADLVEGIRLVRSVDIFYILCFFHGSCPKDVIVGITQNMVLVSRAQLEIVEHTINYNVVKHIGNFKGVIKTTGSTIVNRDRKFDFPSQLDCSPGKSSKEVNQFVFEGGGYSPDYH